MGKKQCLGRVCQGEDARGDSQRHYDGRDEDLRNHSAGVLTDGKLPKKTEDNLRSQILLFWGCPFILGVSFHSGLRALQSTRG